MDGALGTVVSVNVGRERPIAAKGGTTGIDKRAVTGPVAVRAPGPKGSGGSGVAGDHISDVANHGGDDQAVYAYAREDLDAWQDELGRPSGVGDVRGEPDHLRGRRDRRGRRGDVGGGQRAAAGLLPAHPLRDVRALARAGALGAALHRRPGARGLPAGAARGRDHRRGRRAGARDPRPRRHRRHRVRRLHHLARPAAPAARRPASCPPRPWRASGPVWVEHRAPPADSARVGRCGLVRTVRTGRSTARAGRASTAASTAPHARPSPVGPRWAPRAQDRTRQHENRCRNGGPQEERWPAARPPQAGSGPNGARRSGSSRTSTVVLRCSAEPTPRGSVRTAGSVTAASSRSTT